ncbi:MAG TPA: CPBP family intramembrane glutamic endopeptidase [Pirellulales bacterium]
MNVPLPTEAHFVRWAALAEGAIGMVAVLLAWGLKVPVGEGWRLDVATVATGAAATAPLLAAMWLTLRWPLGPFRRLRALVDELIVPLFQAGGLVDFAVISLLAGAGEELLFRGVVQRGLAPALGPWPACLLAAVLFGLCHALNTGYLILATAIGLYLGWLERATGNLAVPILTHALYDFAALVYLVRVRRVPSH